MTRRLEVPKIIVVVGIGLRDGGILGDGGSKESVEIPEITPAIPHVGDTEPSAIAVTQYPVH